MVKGAPERLRTMCEVLPEPSSWHFSQQMAEQGYRVLALAEGMAPKSLDSTQVPPEPSKLKLLGFVGMIDPLRPGVKDAIASCHAAGIAVWMITGDHPATALAIAQDLNLATTASQVVTGQTLVGQSPQDIHHLIQTTCVFARIAPHQKLQLVNAAKASGHFVAVTGDGINDAPALRAANIGVAMGKSGTDVAREASELVISNDNFTTIVAGIEEGRIAYDNIRKVIYLLVSTGGARLFYIAFLVHLLMMYIPLGKSVLAIEPVSFETWGILILLSLTVLLPIELHKLSQFHGTKGKKRAFNERKGIDQI
ncbi:cation transport ATPase [Leptolyngbya sp. PCC 7375]|nr:cation transport ATPase [Leptolyngbya sp. PCC 7375]